MDNPRILFPSIPLFPLFPVCPIVSRYPIISPFSRDSTTSSFHSRQISWLPHHSRSFPVSKYLSRSFVPPVNKCSHPLPSLTLSPKLISGNNWEAEEGAGAGEEGAAKQRVLFKSFLLVEFHSEFRHSHSSPGSFPSPASFPSPGSHPAPRSHFSQAKFGAWKEQPKALDPLWGGFSMRC